MDTAGDSAEVFEEKERRRHPAIVADPRPTRIRHSLTVYRFAACIVCGGNVARRG